MPRIRTIKPEFFFDADLAAIGTIAQLFFVGLWCQADKAGRMKDEPIVLKAKIFPYKNIDGNKILIELTPKFLTRYAGKDGKKYIQINNFSLHQRPHHTEAESIIPALTVKKRLKPRSITDYKGEGKGKEGKGKEGSVYTPEFETFWEAYPKKVIKPKAFEAWQKHKPDLQICLKAIQAQIASGQLNIKEPKFIVYPERWIKYNRWNDKIENTGGISHGTRTIGNKYAGREQTIGS